MSYSNFKPTIWSRFIQNTLEANAVLSDHCNTQFTGEAKKGEQVWILGAPAPTIKDYDEDARTNGIGDPEQLDGVRTPLILDQAKYFNFMVDDIDKMMTVDGMMESIMTEKSHKMLLERETYIGKMALKQEKENMIINANEISSPALAKEVVDGAMVTLRNNYVPLTADVHIELAPWMYYLFKTWVIEAKTDNAKVMDHGIVGLYDQAKVVMANCLFNNGTDDLMMVRTKKAVAFAAGIDSMEAYRPERYFGDAIKGLNVYGATIVRPEELVVIKGHEAPKE